MNDKILLLLMIFAILSCKDDKKINIPNNAVPEVKNKIEAPKKKENKIFIDTFTFVNYNDDGDYMLLNAKKGKDDYGFINDKNDDRNYLIGDLIEIKWEKDTIFIAGDGETPELAEWIIATKKISDGNVSKFRKTYNMQFKYNYAKENNYSQDYLDKIYLIAEYYVANTKNQSLKQLVDSKTQIEYSIEQETRDNIEYTVLGIGNVFEHRVQTSKWLYIGNDYPQKLYEYDLPNDKLIEFK